MRRGALTLAVLLAFASCTPGAMGAPGGVAGGGATTFTIDINLTLHANGYAPDAINVPVGSSIRFMNSDGFAHTATLIPGATVFPASSPFTAAAETQSGTSVSQTWSTGALPAGATSQTIRVDAAGTYLYGCFFHYGAPMRGTIVAQ